MARNLARFVVKPGVVGGLAAAGLIGGNVDSDAGALEHVHDCHADVRIDLVDEARVEQLDGFRAGGLAHAYGTIRWRDSPRPSMPSATSSSG